MADSDNNDNDSTISQFLSFTGSTDTNVATQYLEMSGNNLEMAVSLWMDHNGGAGAGGGASGAGGGGGGSIMAESDAAMAARLAQQDDEVRAPDATRTMRLLGGDSPARGARLPMGMAGLPPGMGAFADPTRDIPPHLLAAMGGPAAREMMMRNMMMMEGQGGDATLGSMGSNWASSSSGGNNAAAAAAAGGGGGGSR